MAAGNGKLTGLETAAVRACGYCGAMKSAISTEINSLYKSHFTGFIRGFKDKLRLRTTPTPHTKVGEGTICLYGDRSTRRVC